MFSAVLSFIGWTLAILFIAVSIIVFCAVVTYAAIIGCYALIGVYYKLTYDPLMSVSEFVQERVKNLLRKR